MAGLSFSVTLETVALDRHLAALRRKLGNLTPVFDEIGGMLVTSTNKRFEDQAGPDGQAWTPLSATTLLLRAQGGIRGKRTVFRKDGGLTARAQKTINAAKILILSGALQKSITHRAAAHQVQVGTDRVQAALMHFGGKAGRGKKVDIPARQILGLSDADRNSILVIVTNALERP
jgi:phage virion morphogenesis protein